MTVSSSTKPVLVFDASALVSWVLQTAGQWQKVQKLFQSDAELVVAASALTETLYIAQGRGNVTPLERLHQSIVAQGVRVESITAEDGEYAGKIIAESRKNPATVTKGGQTRTATLSLGDGLVLAVTHRLGGHAATYDLAWWNFPTLSGDFKLLNPYNIPTT